MQCLPDFRRALEVKIRDPHRQKVGFIELQIAVDKVPFHRAGVVAVNYLVKIGLFHVRLPYAVNRFLAVFWQSQIR
ncbi:hypothetical protein D3C78_1438780 [compost metagenome]